MGVLGGTKTKSNKFNKYLADDEEVLATYKLVIDEIAFTNKRVIFYDKNVLTTKKCRVSIPYHNIDYYAIEDESMFTTHICCKLFTHNNNFDLHFSKFTDILEVEKILADHV